MFLIVKICLIMDKDYIGECAECAVIGHVKVAK
jgi:hypothetical protein